MQLIINRTRLAQNSFATRSYPFICLEFIRLEIYLPQAVFFKTHITQYYA